MLRLLQVMQYMLVDMEYTERELRATFQDIENGHSTFLDLMDALGLESASGAMDMSAVEVIHAKKWISALVVTKMRIGA